MRFVGMLMLTVSLAAVPAGAWAQQGYHYGQHPHWGVDGFGMIFAPVMMLLVIAAAVVVVVLLVRWLGGAGPGGAARPPAGKAPLDILKERFARGEIDAEEFEERRRLLGD